jgi:hypothetical protein
MKVLYMECAKFKHTAVKCLSELVQDDFKIREQKNTTVLFVTIEKGDQLKTFLDFKINVTTPTVVLFPYAHLSQSHKLANLPTAKIRLLEIEEQLKKNYIVDRAAIGWYKDMELTSLAGQNTHFYDSEYTLEELKQNIVDNSTYGYFNLSDLEFFRIREDLDERIINDTKDSISDFFVVKSKYYLFLNGAHAGQPALTPAGVSLFEKIREYTKNMFKRNGYLAIHTPHIWSNISKNVQSYYALFPNRQFKCAENGIFRIASCLGAYKYFQTAQYLEEDLPVGFYDINSMYRFEQKGELKGLYRLRTFTMTDLHVFVVKSQLMDEFKKCLKMSINTIDYFIGANYSIIIRYNHDYCEFSKSICNILKEVAPVAKVYYEEMNDSKFYWFLKLEIVKVHENTVMQLSTVQIDGKNAEMMGLKVRQSNQKMFIIHTSPVGSIERLICAMESVYKTTPIKFTSNELVVFYDINLITNEEFLEFKLNYETEKTFNTLFIPSKFKNLSKYLLKLEYIDYGLYTVIGLMNFKENSILVKDNNRPNNTVYNIKLTDLKTLVLSHL